MVKMPNKETEREVKWIRWQNKWAWGAEAWQYETVPADLDLKPYNDNLAEFLVEALERGQENGFSERYRGIDAEFVTLPPAEVLTRFLAMAENRVKMIKKKMKFYSCCLGKHLTS